MNNRIFVVANEHFLSIHMKRCKLGFGYRSDIRAGANGLNKSNNNKVERLTFITAVKNLFTQIIGIYAFKKRYYESSSRIRDALSQRKRKGSTCPNGGRNLTDISSCRRKKIIKSAERVTPRTG